MKDLGTLGGPDAFAQLINDRGEVTGISYPPIDPAIGTPVVHPFLWRNGNMIDVGSLGGTDSEPTGLNQNGEVVGFSSLAGDAKTHPFYWKTEILKISALSAGTTERPTGSMTAVRLRAKLIFPARPLRIMTRCCGETER